MNGEKQMDEFINRPCKDTVIKFVKALFSGKNPAPCVKRAKRNKYMNFRWRSARCDIHRHGSPFENCQGCPFAVSTKSPYFPMYFNRCYFEVQADGVYNIKMSHNDFNQHVWPKILMKDIGFILLGAVQIKSMLEIKREEKSE